MAASLYEVPPLVEEYWNNRSSEYCSVFSVGQDGSNDQSIFTQIDSASAYSDDHYKELYEVPPYKELYEVPPLVEEYWNNRSSEYCSVFSVGQDGRNDQNFFTQTDSTSANKEDDDYETIPDPFQKYTPGENVSQLKFVDANINPLPKSLKNMKGCYFTTSEKKKLAAYFNEKFREQNYKIYKELPKNIQRKMIKIGIGVVRDKMRLCMAKETFVVLKSRFFKVAKITTEEEIYSGTCYKNYFYHTTAFQNPYQENHNSVDQDELQWLLKKYYNLRCQYNREFEMVVNQYQNMYPEFYASLKKLM